MMLHPIQVIYHLFVLPPKGVKLRRASRQNPVRGRWVGMCLNKTCPKEIQRNYCNLLDSGSIGNNSSASFVNVEIKRNNQPSQNAFP